MENKALQLWVVHSGARHGLGKVALPFVHRRTSQRPVRREALSESLQTCQKVFKQLL